MVRLPDPDEWPLPKKISLLAAMLTLVVLGVVLLVLRSPETSPGTGQAIGYTPPPEDSRPVVAFIGDSYTQGTGATDEARRWTSVLSSMKGWREVNLGRGGTGYLTSASVEGCGLDYCPPYPEMVASAVAAAPSIVVIAGGQNDLALWPERAAEVTAAITQAQRDLRAQLPDAQLLVVGPSTPGAVDDTVEEYQAAVQAAAGEVGATYVSLLEPPALVGDWKAADGVHANDLGHQEIADRVASALS